MSEDNDANFLFATCQLGAEGALKLEMSRNWPQLRLAFSRPGFVTFKLPAALTLDAGSDMRSVFARTYGVSLGRIEGDEGRVMADQFWELMASQEVCQLHVWQRDDYLPGERGFEPGISSLAEQVGQRIVDQRPQRSSPVRVNRIAPAGSRIIDCVLVEPGQWWIGCHHATSIPRRWPGGVYPVRPPVNMLSRAYLKMSEALAWSKLPLEDGDRCVEIGSAPGGAAQKLLERGLHVTGIDPAEVDPALLQNDHFRHLRKRGQDVRRREFHGAHWLFVDSNVAPQNTLDQVESIVTHRDVQIRGLLLTLKLLDWSMAEEIPQYLARVRSWGYAYVKARQLAFNRQEICVAAMRRRAMRRCSAKRHQRRARNRQATESRAGQSD